MKKQFDLSGAAIFLATIILVASGFFWIYQDMSLSLIDKLAFSGFWLILGFVLISYSAGIGKGEDKMKISVPKTPAKIIFTMAFLLFGVAALMSNMK